jgi:hypothetical protein
MEGRRPRAILTDLGDPIRRRWRLGGAQIGVATHDLLEEFREPNALFGLEASLANTLLERGLDPLGEIGRLVLHALQDLLDGVAREHGL